MVVRTRFTVTLYIACRRLHLQCDGTRAEIRFRLSAKWTSPFKSAGASAQSTTGSRVLSINDSNAGYTMFRGSVKRTGYPLHSPASPSLPLLSVTVCHHINWTLPYFCVCIITWLVYAWNISSVTAELRDVAVFCNCCLTKCVWHKKCRYVYEKSTCRITRGLLQRYVSLPHSTRRRKIFSHCSHVVILIFWKNFVFFEGLLTYIIALSHPHHISARNGGCHWL